MIIVAAALAFAAPLDHRGQWGLTAGAGAVKLFTVSQRFGDVVIFEPAVSLGATLAWGDAGEFFATVAGTAPVATQPRYGGAIALGTRVYAGEEELKTFLGAAAILYVAPLARIGGRLSVGLQYDVSARWGAFVEAAAEGLVGNGLAFGGGGVLGAQVRFF